MDLDTFWAPYRGAVSLTFDDGLESQLTKALPAMEQAGVKATFYLGVRGGNWATDKARWAEVAARGHEIGNHSLSHTCSRNLWGSRGLEDMTVEEVERDIVSAQERLDEIAPHQEQWTFAYPCYDTFVGRGASRQSYVPVVAKRFLAGRGRGQYGFANRPDAVDLACVWCTPTERMSGFEMIGLVEGLATRGLWIVLTFHEIDGSRLTVGSYDFGVLLEYLQRRSNEIWTAPLGEVAEKIAGARSQGP